MKKIKPLVFLIVVLVFSGCGDFLSYNETAKYTDDLVFSDRYRTRDWVNNIYTYIGTDLNSVGGAMRASGADDAEEANTFYDIQKMNDGRWSAAQTVDSRWAHDEFYASLYQGIRQANVFLEKFDLDNFDSRQYNDDYQNMMAQFRLFPYQARFLRAFFYFRLIRRYGQVPLVTKPIYDLEKANNVKPSSYEEITDFIISECNAIIPKLPITYHSLPFNETGRVTKGAAMALKAKALLYAASPLHNTTGNVDKWKKAAAAYHEIITTGWYTLEEDYSDIFNNYQSEELIFGRREDYSNYFEKDNFPAGFEGTTKSGTHPTQNLVNAYEMQATGLPISDPNSGYDPQHPYQGRDPRLKKTIIVNNSMWKGRRVEIWRGGLDGLPKPGATRTGYYLKKYVIEDVSLDPSNTTTAIHAAVIFRYGGILLSYAEAMNEAYGPDNPAGMTMSARDAVNLVRKRAEMPPFPAGMTKQAFREKLRNERRVEMAFENQRFWDIRRWKIGPSTTKILGMKITKNSDGTFSYDQYVIENRVWTDRMYLYPIPQSELFKNDALEQNPGW